MFGDKFEKQFAEVTRDVEPYRNMAIGFEVEKRLQDYELELLGYSRHLLTSNDRYQLSTLYLIMAQNRALLMDSIYDSMKASKGSQGRIDETALASASQIIVDGYNAAQNYLGEADRIGGYVGFAASQSDLNQLSTHAHIDWPVTAPQIKGFISGGIKGLESMYANAASLFQEAMSNNLVPNDFKIELKRQVNPLLNEADSRQKSINRLTGGISSAITSEAAMSDINGDLIKAFGFIDQIIVWLTMPRLYNATFTLSRPLNELQPQQKRFDPNILGKPVVQKAIAQPPVPEKSFDPNVLKPKPAAPPQKAFDPSDLEKPRQTAGQPAEGRHFDPASLNKPSTSPAGPAKNPDKTDSAAKHFDPKILDK